MNPLDDIRWPPEVLWGYEGKALNRSPRSSSDWFQVGYEPWYERPPNMLSSREVFVSSSGGTSREPTFTERLMATLFFSPVILAALICRAGDRMLRLMRLMPPLPRGYESSPFDEALSSLFILCARNGRVIIAPDGQMTCDGTATIGPRLNEAAVRGISDYFTRLSGPGEVKFSSGPLEGVWSLTGATDADGRTIVTAQKGESKA